MRALALGLVGLLALLVGCTAAAVPEAGAPAAEASSGTALPVSPTFEDAVAVAADGRGRLYVVDAGAATLVVLERAVRAWVPLLRFGGPGSGEYALLGPSGVDPTNGLVAYLADTGNGRIQQIDADGRLLQSLRVPTTASALASTGTRRDPTDRRDFAEEGGRPVGVALRPGGGLAVLEADGPSLLLLDAAGEVERVAGAPGMPGPLADPVAVVASGDGIVVADRARGAILFYDAYGTYRQGASAHTAGDLVGLARAPGGVLAVGQFGVLLFTLQGRLERQVGVPEGVRLRGAAVVGGQLIGLTATGLVDGLEPTD